MSGIDFKTVARQRKAKIFAAITVTANRKNDFGRANVILVFFIVRRWRRQRELRYLFGVEVISAVDTMTHSSAHPAQNTTMGKYFHLNFAT